MPKQPQISDWDRLFDKRTPPRRGPIALFVTMTLLLGFCVVLMISARLGVNQYGKIAAAQALTATPLWREYYEQQTATAQALAVTATPTAAPVQTAGVTAVGNLRSEPRIAPETVLGQVAAGDTLVLLETTTVESATWYRVRVETTTGALAPGSEGWISSTLLSLP